jgi:hypothetical protein
LQEKQEEFLDKIDKIVRIEAKRSEQRPPRVAHFVWRVFLREDPNFGFYRHEDAPVHSRREWGREKTKTLQASLGLFTRREHEF